ncbi:hypothetical protein EPUL_005419 [Erysiphe pulchra]|uniref:Uncharacterized protein n=1 Tax=Erysiphe pulchra TaxID=225359 RepID=A0A2S4PKW6_9PEZI|nr:hypothetical protein EPUL_005419 [Erysiphe pulchra]
MTGIPSEEVVDVLGELAQVTDATQFLSGVQRNPELVFEAVKTLAQQSVGEETAASQLENAYKKILEKERQLDESAKELKATKKELKEYEKSPRTNVVLGKLVDVLDRLQLPGQKSAAINNGTVFNGDERLEERSQGAGKLSSSLKNRSKSSSCNLVLSSVAVNGDSWEENSHFVIPCIISDSNKNQISSLALIDSGASAFGFINTKFVREHKLKLIPLEKSRSLKVFDGTESISGQVTHMVRITLDIKGHSEVILLFITTLANFDIVLGLPWLQFHNPEIQWDKKLLCFNKQGCKGHSTNKFPIVISSAPMEEMRKRRIGTIDNKKIDASLHTEYCDAADFEDSVDNGETLMIISIEDIEEALKEKPQVNVLEKLPKIYHDFLSVFSRDEAEKTSPAST